MLLIIHSQYNQKPLKDHLEEHLPDHFINWPSPFFYYSVQAVLSVITFSKTKSEFWKKCIKVQIYLVIIKSFMDLTQNRENTYRFIVFLISFVIFFRKQVWYRRILTQWEKWNLLISYWSHDVLKKLLS